MPPTYSVSRCPLQSTTNELIQTGGPGAGTGTLCKLLAEDFNLAHICPGEPLRAAIKDEFFTPEGMTQIQQAMKEGKFSPVSTTLAVLHEELLSINAPVLLDGFPRCVEQMELFEDLVGFQPTLVTQTDVQYSSSVPLNTSTFILHP